MKVFDRIDAKSLDRRTWQLWVLALTTILVLVAGLALMMYTVMFSKPVEVNGHNVAILFMSYCVLIPLVVGYLNDRQLVNQQLRRRMSDEETQIMYLQHEIRANFLERLPGVDHLAMEYRRASRAEQPISLLLVGVKLSQGVNSPMEMTAVFGDAAKALARKLRGEDSIYHFDAGIFSIIFPRVPTTIAQRVMENLENGLQDAAGPESRFSFEVQVTNYPEDAASAREMEQAVRDFFAGRSDKPLVSRHVEPVPKVT